MAEITYRIEPFTRFRLIREATGLKPAIVGEFDTEEDAANFKICMEIDDGIDQSQTST